MSYSICKYRHKMCDGCMACYDEPEDDFDKCEDEEKNEEDDIDD